MPIYEYKCSACGHVSSVLVQGFKDPEGLSCEQCGHTGLAKIISAVNYHGSHGDRLADYDPRSRKGDGFFRDTRNIGLEAERMLKKAGVEPTDDFKNKLERARTDPGRHDGGKSDEGGEGAMKGKIDKNGYLWKDVPGAGWVKCTCVNSACLQTGDFYCYHGCVAFEGPNTMPRCKSPFCTINDPDINCRQCEHWGDVYEIKICQGRQLFFDEFEDERVKP